MRPFSRLLAILLLVSSHGNAQTPPDGADAAGRPALRLELGVRADGTGTPLWRNGIAVSIGTEAADEAIREPLPLSDNANEWLGVLRSTIAHAERRSGEWAAVLGVAALDATVVAGNRASADAFGWIPDHIGINLQAFADAYGPPDGGAADRMTRILAHEYVHLLTYAHYPDHLERRRSPLDRALWTMFFEGLGDYVSVSSRWLPDKNGGKSATASEALDRLEPILVERLEQFVIADDSQERQLRRGISMGKFDEKWGSLPVALWLHSEVAECEETVTLRAVLNLERDSVLVLARRHAAPELQSRIEALIRQAGTMQPPPGRTTCIADFDRPSQ